MSNTISFREAVTAYANGATVWLFSAGELVQGLFWDVPREDFRNPHVRAEAARACAHTLRKFIRYEDPEVQLRLTW